MKLKGLSLICFVNSIISLLKFFNPFSWDKAKGSSDLSDKNLSVVRHCWRRRCRGKLYTFSSSNPEPMDQFQQNVAKRTLGKRSFKFLQMKGYVLSQGEIITKEKKYYDEI